MFVLQLGRRGRRPYGASPSRRLLIRCRRRRDLSRYRWIGCSRLRPRERPERIACGFPGTEELGVGGEAGAVEAIEHVHQFHALGGGVGQVATGTHVGHAVEVRLGARGLELRDRGGQLGDEGLAEREGLEQVEMLGGSRT